MERGGEENICEDRLIQDILNGDREKYALLINRYRDELYRLVYAILRHPEDAEDVLQEAFVQIFLSLSRYEGRGLKTWMARIAVNKALDYKRKRSRAKEERFTAEGRDDFGEGREPVRDAVGENVATREQASLVRKRVEELPAAYRDVIKAYYFQEKSYKEIAEETGLAVKSVEARLYRAKQWIRRHWKEEEFW